MADSSFDVVSKIDRQEVDNALTSRCLAQPSELFGASTKRDGL